MEGVSHLFVVRAEIRRTQPFYVFIVGEVL